ncbi:MAG: hypothetical protein ABIG28_00390 [archaeon]
MKYLKPTERKKLIRELTNLYNISELPKTIIKINKEQLNAFSGNLNKELLTQLTKTTRVESIGLPIIEKTNNQTKLTFDALNILKPEKPILEINEEQYNQWIRGHDIDIETNKGTIILKYEEDLVGIAKSSNGKIFNSVPKDRRVKDRIIK